MNERIIILFFSILFTATTLFLYIWKAKKQIEYKNDERWQKIIYKANNSAKVSLYILIIIVAITNISTLFSNIKATFSLSEVLIFGTLFFGLYTFIELFSLLYFDRKM